MEEKEEKLPPVEAEELDEEQAARELAEEDEKSTAQQMAAAVDPEASVDDPPVWASHPEWLKLPAEGTTVAFIRIPSKWTRTPSAGDRTCICWPIGETEERLAYNSSRGDANRAITELTKQAIRAVDGHKPDRSANMKTPGSVVAFWSEIGPKGRSMLRNWYLRTHTVTDEEALDFFSNHFVNVTVRRG